jgi:hypothetical protein
MARCPSCDYPLPEDREPVGARCPSCRDPLYEPPGRFGRPIRAGEAACGVHHGNESIGTCTRCGTFYCETCRCNWRGHLLCAACVGKALDNAEGSPEGTRTHFRQALLSLVLGLGAWVLALPLALMIRNLLPASDKAVAPNPVAVQLIPLAIFGILGLVFVALFGIGQGAAAIRTRGNHLVMANLGLILNGLYVGVLIGLGLTFWKLML